MYYAQELKENTYNLTRMNLVMRGILPDNIVARNGDTPLKTTGRGSTRWRTRRKLYNPLFVDAVVSNPPTRRMGIPLTRRSIHASAMA